MSISRESQYSRRRSNTAQSVFKVASAPIQHGESKVLTAWVHDPKDSPNVLLNHGAWPGVCEGDLLHLSQGDSDEQPGFLFVVAKEEAGNKPQLQVSLARSAAETFYIRNNTEVTLTKVDKTKHEADYVEFVFQDQYLGRNEMWRLGEQLAGQCLHVGQEVSFIGAIVARVDAIYIRGESVPSGLVTTATKSVYRTLSAKVTLFIQVCRELWEFSNDGERYNEKIVHSFLPELFTRWKQAGTNHTVTIVLISRVFYDRSEVDFAEGPLRKLEDGRWYKDFFKVITDLEVVYDWQPTLVSLKDSFWAFQRDILLTHHYHRSWQTTSTASVLPEEARLVGQLAHAHDGPILEALNMALNPTEKHYIDRSLSLTGVSMILITPGTGWYRVSKQLVRLTTTRMLDQGLTLELVSLAKPPLHRTPIFSFRGVEPELLGAEKIGRYGSRALDPLWGGDDTPAESQNHTKSEFWYEPFWICMNFWDQQMDMPMREDRFVARAKMHMIQMLGLLDYDVLSSIEVPFLQETYSSLLSPMMEKDETAALSVAKEEADKFDNDIFAFNTEPREVKLSVASRASSTVSSGTGSLASSLRDKRGSQFGHRLSTSTATSKITPIEESPRVINQDLYDEHAHENIQITQTPLIAESLSGLSTSPSGASIISARSSTSKKSSERRRQGASTSATALLSSKFTPSWLFNPFRSAPSQPETTTISAAGESTPSPSSPLRNAIHELTPHSPARTTPSLERSRSPQPMPIRKAPQQRQRVFEETVLTHRGSLPKHTISPVSSSPRDELIEKRRSATSGSGTYAAGPYSLSSSPSIRPNPSSPQVTVSYNQASLARRWQHMFPRPVYMYETNWRSLVTPYCLPLTTEHFPTASELDTSYDVFSYDLVADPPETHSFLVRPPVITSTNPDDIRRAWALVVMRGMVAIRLAQGFQFVLRSSEAKPEGERENPKLLRGSTFVADDDMMPKPRGAAEALQVVDPVYLSMSNEIHRISYTGETVQVRRYVRRVPAMPPFDYKCLLWPKLGVGYTELSTPFASHGLENYGWNRLDMLVAGYEQQFNESLRYWRTRFIVIPTAESTHHTIANDRLNEEESRILGIEKLGELFSRVRWQPAEEHALGPPQPVRFLPTYLSPSAMLSDERLLEQLDDIHAAGPLRKKMKSERDFAELSANLSAVARAMREENGVPVKEHRWHRAKYPESFIGHEFVTWLVREFRDVSTRDQGTDWGVKLMERGLFEHCTGRHGFLDGHYFYQFKGEFAAVSTPRVGWFLSRASSSTPHNDDSHDATASVPRIARRPKRLILSQSMVIDIDPNKKSDQNESAILHHDIIHNPSTVFHFELQWVGTTARCIEDLLRTWTRTIERYGLTLVEAYVNQIADIADNNPFQSCFPIPLVVLPPSIPHLAQRIPEGTSPTFYFEYALLKRFNFVVDVEPPGFHPSAAEVEPVYSYRRAPFTHPQFVHRSGVAFVQIIGGEKGFVFLINRLVGAGRVREGLGGSTSAAGGTGTKGSRLAAMAEDLRKQLYAFCSDAVALSEFYDKEVSQLASAPSSSIQEPPLLDLSAS
ncbi:hypothetical protein PENSPDRAFT_621231 [Peniophora sp. CONT]|nr:hypothetical protein PENSPDRAFT_621231 [Peniophora sp. CONT]